MSDLTEIMSELTAAMKPLEFGEPVTHIYNPFEYAKEPAELYATKWGFTSPREAVFIGMNPGPWGMAQTGVPFGEVEHVREWLQIEGNVEKPPAENEKRPIEGFACERSEVSGRRLWGWAKETFGTPEVFFDRFFIWNYCPLVFMEEGGRNFTPDKLSAEERDALFAPCDAALRQLAKVFTPRMFIGVGVFAEKRIQTALEGMDIEIGRILHPSPASPKANRGWQGYVEEELAELGIKV